MDKLLEGGVKMKVSMSPFLTKSKGIVKELVLELSKEFQYVSVLGTDTKGKTYSVSMAGVEISDSMWCERGFVVRVHNGINYSEFSFNQVEENNLQSIIEQIKNGLNEQISILKASKQKMSTYPIVQEEKITSSFYGEVEKLPDTLTSEYKIKKLTAIKEKAVKYCDKLANFMADYEEVNVSKIFISKDKELEQSYIWSVGSVVAIVRRNDITKYNYKTCDGLKGVELLDQMEDGYKEAIDGAVMLLDAKPAKPGEYDVICAPELSGVIAHEAFGHGVEMDMFVKNRAKAVEYIDKYVASDLVTMHDGAAAAKQVSSYLFDDEGVLGSDTVVIDNGILKTGISDTLSALRLGTKPTGNGKRQSFERKAYARMTNTFFAPGNDKLEEMIASVKHGYLISGMMSGMEDPKNWGIQCVALMGKEIKDGKFTGNIISPVLMTGYVPDLLKSISMVSDKIELFGSGACGKGYKEYAKVSDGGPYIKARVRLG